MRLRTFPLGTFECLLTVSTIPSQVRQYLDYLQAPMLTQEENSHSPPFYVAIAKFDRRLTRVFLDLEDRHAGSWLK